MRSPADGLLRLGRAVILAVVTVLLSAMAHALGGQALPGVADLGALAGLVVVPCLALTRRRLSLPALIVVLAVGQVILHQAFMNASMTGMRDGPSAQMLSAHVVATVVLAAVMARGERAAWHLWCWLTPLVLRVVAAVAAVVPQPRRPMTPPVGDPLLRGPLVLSTALGRRGPPVAAG